MFIKFTRVLLQIEFFVRCFPWIVSFNLLRGASEIIKLVTPILHLGN